MDYENFLDGKIHLANENGFDPLFIPDFLYDFQKHLVSWSIQRGRSAIFADCGLGKTPMQLVWAENVFRKTGKPVLIVTPLAVGVQTIAEGKKFGIECERSQDGKVKGPITVTNYERLHLFTSSDYSGVVCDESSILKNYDGKRRAIITEFLRLMPYRLLCTATAAPNDYTELGTSAEALGIMGHMDMLGRFFKNTQNTSDTKKRWAGQGGGYDMKWRFKKHAEQPFWRWICSWARAIRRPSDLDFSDDGFILPPLHEVETIVEASRPLNGYLFPMPAHGLKEQREERRETIQERCETVAEKVNKNSLAVSWCHLNQEGDFLEKIITGSKQVSGSMSDDEKEEVLTAFARGEVRVLITKPKIGAFGLNWQHCNHITFFPSHSYEQYYQGVRRCWRFGQTKPVKVDIITTKGEEEVKKRLMTKAKKADKMFTELVKYMKDELHINRKNEFTKTEEVPSWL